MTQQSIERPISMTDDEELLNKLHAKKLFPYVENGNTIERIGYVNPDGPEAATRIVELRQQVERLEVEGIAFFRAFCRGLESLNARRWSSTMTEHAVKTFRTALTEKHNG